MSIKGTVFGNGEPKIQKVGSSEVLTLYKSLILTPGFLIPDQEEIFSPLSRERSLKYFGNFSEFELQINLFKYRKAIHGYTPLGFYEKIISLFGNNIYFYPSSTGQILKDSAGNKIEFYISDYNVGFLTRVDYFEILFLTIKSTKHTDPAKSSVGNYLLEPDGVTKVVDPDGNYVYEPS